MDLVVIPMGHNALAMPPWATNHRHRGFRGMCKKQSAEMGSWGVTPEGPKTGILRYFALFRMDSPDSHVREMLIECTVG